MKKLESLLGEKFTPLENSGMLKITGGEKPTTENRATQKFLGGGCSRADKYTNDKFEWVGDTICVPDTTSIHPTISMFVIEGPTYEEAIITIDN